MPWASQGLVVRETIFERKKILVHKDAVEVLEDGMDTNVCMRMYSRVRVVMHKP